MDHSKADEEVIPGQNETARVDVQVVPIQKRPLAPLFWSRMTCLFFAFAFLVVAGSLCWAAFAKFRSAEKALAAALPIGTVVTINIGSLQASNALLLTACFLTAFLMALYMLVYSIRPRSLRSGFIDHTIMLMVCMLLLLAAVIAQTAIWSTRLAQIYALGVDGTAIAQLVVDEAAASVGISKALKGYYYVHLTVVFAWVGWWLALIACIVLFATDMSASELLQAGKKEHQREADRYRSRSHGEILMGKSGGGRVHKVSYGKEREKTSEGSSEPSSATTPKAGQIEGITETTRDEGHHIRN